MYIGAAVQESSCRSYIFNNFYQTYFAGVGVYQQGIENRGRDFAEHGWHESSRIE